MQQVFVAMARASENSRMRAWGSEKEVKDASDPISSTGRFVRSKLNPVLGTIVDLAANGENMVGEKVNLLGYGDANSALFGVVTPLVIQEAIDTLDENGFDDAAQVFLISFLGLGVSQYKEKKKKRKKDPNAI